MTLQVEEESLGIMDLLEAYPSARPPLALLLQMLPALSPRFYSFASSPLVSPTRIRLAFSVVGWTTPQGRLRKGLCTNWLLGLCQAWSDACKATPHDNVAGPRFSIFVAPSQGFKLPQDPGRDIIMVGPGTGVAPFVGFLQHRCSLAEERRAEQISMGVRCTGFWRGLSLTVPDECIEQAPIGAWCVWVGVCVRARVFVSLLVLLLVLDTVLDRYSAIDS